MRPRIVLGFLLFAAPALALAAAPAFVPNRAGFAEDERVAVTLHAISEAKRFDEAAARRLMPILLVDGLSPEEQDIYYEIIAARTPIQIRAPFGPPFPLPPPDGAAREYMTLLKTVVESPNLQATLDARWLAGGREMKDLVDISTFGSQLNNAILTYVTRKLAADVTTGNVAEGFTALKDNVTKVRAQLAMTDIDTERRGKTLLYNALRDIDGRMSNSIPDELYADMKP